MIELAIKLAHKQAYISVAVVSKYQIKPLDKAVSKTSKHKY
jgi:transketolase C-terminal domain/subunit